MIYIYIFEDSCHEWGTIPHFLLQESCKYCRSPAATSQCDPTCSPACTAVLAEEMTAKCIREEHTHIGKSLPLRIYKGRRQLLQLGKYRQPALLVQGSSDGWKKQWAGSVSQWCFTQQPHFFLVALLEHFSPDEGSTASVYFPECF